MRYGTIKGKMKRSTHKYDKCNSVLKKKRDGHEKELGYQTGIATGTVKKNLPATNERNPKRYLSHNVDAPFITLHTVP